MSSEQYRKAMRGVVVINVLGLICLAYLFGPLHDFLVAASQFLSSSSSG